MKSLKEHILEGILDIEDNINIDSSEITKDVIEQFLKENYKIKGSYNIKETKNGFIVDVKGDIVVKNVNITTLTNEFFEFGKVSRDFDCNYCGSLTSLEGAPKEVGGGFICHSCNSLKSLEGAPERVDGNFNCGWCDSLTSLEGAPKEVGRDFYCGNCKLLKSLKNAPEKVGGEFDCHSCNSLKSLEGAPKEVGWDFFCNRCNLLTSLEGAPKEVGGSFNCRGCGIQFTEDDVRKYTKVNKNIYA